ncbi:MAG: hypothetical protein NDI69_17960 [Bacteriovoracaceae bacterium]|nr:hypothetical protein [Bacteriovoracaceae bacterium]
MIGLLIGLLLFSFEIKADDSARCAEYSNDCEYYSCVAEAKHCQNSSYPIRFGRRFCLRYGDRSNNFSENGKTWIEEVRKCLIREMSTYEEHLSCRQLKRRAFKDHAPCYLESGFCRLSFRDKKQVLKTIWPSLTSPYVQAGGFRILRACSN